MSEADWLACTNPRDLLAYISGIASKRKLRLFAAACCRLVEDQLPVENRASIEVIERYADGAAKIEELSPIAALKLTIPPRESVFAVITLGHAASMDADFATGARTFSDMAYSGKHPWQRPTTWDFQVPWLRDIFGNPFNNRDAFVSSPGLNMATVQVMARQIYENRAFELMPRLAVELKRSGIDDEEVLSHCNGQNHHVRGCWVLDKILGKE